MVLQQPGGGGAWGPGGGGATACRHFSVDRCTRGFNNQSEAGWSFRTGLKEQPPMGLKIRPLKDGGNRPLWIGVRLLYPAGTD